MFKVGDLVIYSSIGICRIDDICEETYSGKTRKYYVLQPIEEQGLTIHNPVDNDKVTMLTIMTREEAQETLEMFKLPGAQWVERGNDRTKKYNEIVNEGNRREVAKVLNTLLRKKYEFEEEGKKLSDPDRKLLLQIKSILLKELSIALETSFEEIDKQVKQTIRKHLKSIGNYM